MLKTKDWFQTLFTNAKDAILIFKDDELVVSNKAAQELQEETNYDPNYLLQVINTNRQQLTNQIDNCISCDIKKKMDNSSPLSLGKGQHPLKFSLSYQIIDPDENIFAVILTSRDQIQRINNLAQQRRLNRYVNRAHEAERQHISQDLHDSIAQGVYSAIMGVRRIGQEDLSHEQIQKLTKVIELQLNDTLNEVKGMALDIRPSVLDTFGLGAALKALAKRLQENTGIDINVIDQTSHLNLSEDVQNVLYRVGQEAINNALKHANADGIYLLLVSHENAIQLDIIDDGQGFDVAKNQTFNGHSLGLLNMNERVKALGGVFSIDSKIGEGTTVTVRFPTR